MRITRIGLAVGLLLSLAGPVTAAMPDPSRRILTGVYVYPNPVYEPYDVFNPSSFYHFQNIRDAGIDVLMIPISKEWSANGTSVSSIDESLDATHSVASGDTLWLIAGRDSIVAWSYWLPSTPIPNDTEIRTVLDHGEFDDAFLMGWYLYDEPHVAEAHGGITINSIDSTMVMKRRVRSANADFLAGGYNCDGNAKWTTFTGWFFPRDTTNIGAMLEAIDDFYETAGDTVGTRPVFGVEGYRFYEDDSPEGGYSICILNEDLAETWEEIRKPERTHAGNPNMYPYWSIPHVSDEEMPTGWNFSAPPSLASLRQELYTRLAWGAKGIVYYTYSNGPGKMNDPEDLWCDETNPTHHPGVFTGTVNGDTCACTGFNDVYDWITSINEEIHTIKGYIGPATCMRPAIATLQGEGDADHDIAGAPYPYESNYYDESGARFDRAREYYATGYLKRFEITSGDPAGQGTHALAAPFVDGTKRYLLVTNQTETNWLTGQAGAGIDFRLVVDTDEFFGSGAYRFTDVVGHRSYVASSAGDSAILIDHLDSGEGKLYVVTKIGATDLVVTGHDTMVIAAGSTIAFDGGKKIQVRGVLEAEDVTFTKSGSTAWNGIYLDSTGARLTLADCTIENGYYGVYGTTGARSVQVGLSDCVFQNNTKALYFLGNSSYRSHVVDSSSVYQNNNYDAIYVVYVDATSRIKECAIHHNNGWGIFLANNDAGLSWNAVYRNKAGIRLYNADSDVEWCDSYYNVKDPSSIGPGLTIQNSEASILALNVYTNGMTNAYLNNSSPSISSTWFYTDSSFGASTEMQLAVSSHPYIDEGHNNFHTTQFDNNDNPISYSSTAINNTGNNGVSFDAEMNWWGHSSPRFAQIITVDSLVDASPCASSPYYPKPARDPEMRAERLAFRTAFRAERAGDHRAARERYLDIVARYPNSDEAVQALWRLFITMKKSGVSLEDIEAFYTNIAAQAATVPMRQAGAELARWAVDRSSNHRRAITMHRAAGRDESLPAERRQVAWYQAAWQAAMIEDEPALGEAVNAIMALGDTTDIARIARKDWGDRIAEIVLPAEATEEPILAAQPNPFNPSTAITFRMSEMGAVRLAVYNVAGQLVRTLADDTRAAGVYTVTWNGDDTTGRQVASGVYLVRMTTPTRTLTHRITMVK